MSEIRTNLLKSERGDASPSAPFGLRVSGVTTTGTLTVSGNATIGGNLGVAGTITYEDVKNVDSVGVVTARTGIHIDDSITHIGDTNTKIRFPGADTVSVETAGQQNVQVDGSRVLLKSPSGTNTTVRLQHQGNSGYGDIILDRQVNAFSIDNDPSNASNNQSYFSVKNKGAENLRITSGGRLLYGDHLNDRGSELQYEGSQHAGIGIHRNTADHGAPSMHFSASRGTSAGSNTIVQSGDYLGMINFKGADGSDLASGAYITGIVDGTPGSNDMPTRLAFWTSADGSQSPDERLRISSRGKVSFTKHEDTAAYGASDWANTGSGNRSNASQASPEGSFQWQSNTGQGVERYKSYIQSTAANQADMYIHLVNSSFYRITITGKHNSQSADVAMYLVYGLNNTAARIQQVTSSGGFTVTAHNTHVNSHDTTIKINYSGSLNQGMRALVEIIGGF